MTDYTITRAKNDAILEYMAKKCNSSPFLPKCNTDSHKFLSCHLPASSSFWLVEETRINGQTDVTDGHTLGNHYSRLEKKENCVCSYR